MQHPDRAFWLGLGVLCVLFVLANGCGVAKWAFYGPLGGAASTSAPSTEAGVPFLVWAAAIGLVVVGALAGGLFKSVDSAKWCIGVGVGLLGVCFVLNYVAKTSPWLVKWSYGVVVLALLSVGADWYLARRQVFRKTTALNTIVPAIELVEPKKEGDAPSGPVKAAVAAVASANRTTGIVGAEVSAVKRRLKI